MAARLDIKGRGGRPAEARADAPEHDAVSAPDLRNTAAEPVRPEAAVAAEDFTFSITTGPNGTLIFEDGAGERVVGATPTGSGLPGSSDGAVGGDRSGSHAAQPFPRWPVRDVPVSGSYVFDHIAEFGVNGRLSVPGLSGSGAEFKGRAELDGHRPVSRLAFAMDETSSSLEIASADDGEDDGLYGRGFNLWTASGER